MTSTCVEHGVDISTEEPCDDCMDIGVMTDTLCDNCSEECYCYKGICLHCGGKVFDWVSPMSIEALPRSRPCPTCIEAKVPNAIMSEFRWNGHCYQCGTLVPVDLRWYYRTVKKKEQSEEDYLQSFENSIIGLLNG